MLPVVPELGPEGYTHTADSLPDTPRSALAILPDGESWCRVNCPPGVAGRIHVRPRYADLYLGLTAAAGTIEYTDLSFGYTLGGSSAQWPPSGTRYFSSDQQWLLVERITYPVQSVLTLTIWAQDAERFETTWEFLSPRPVSPGPGFSWDAALGDWVAA